jgi:Uncharacterized protein conserved in bacteria (DUF2188)
MKGGKKTIHVLPDGEQDWLVREEGGREFGHYPTRAEAETVGHKLARKRGVEPVVHGASGKVRRTPPRKGWVSRLFGR